MVRQCGRKIVLTRFPPRHTTNPIKSSDAFGVREQKDWLFRPIVVQAFFMRQRLLIRLPCFRSRSALISAWARGFVLAGLLVVGFAPADLSAATTTYDTLNTPYTGGTINPGDTVLLNDGASVTGNITADGTLQFNQTQALTINNLISGTGTLSLTNTGTLNLTGTSGAANTVVLDMTTSASLGLLQIRSGTGTLRVGNSGSGTLNVTGGRVTNTIGSLGYGGGSVGTATVSSGTWANSSYLYVGHGGTGTLNVTGGRVTNTQIGYIGYNYGSSGTATVSGSGTWTNTAGLRIGESGTGTLNVTGGSVTNTTGYIGSGVLSVGTVTVSSGTWANSASLRIGEAGIGTLNVTGGSVTNTTGTIGNLANSVGTATVSGSGTWASSGNLTVGGSGTGTLTMNGGLVTVGGTLSQGGNGTINLNSGGTLQIGTGTTGGVLGVAALTNNGTLIFNRSNASTYSGSISGTGAVTKQGGGTLTLDGANSYSGLTTISGGTLQVGNSGTTGSIAGNVVNNSTLIFNRSDASTYSGIISGTGAVTKQGAGTLTLTGTTSSWTNAIVMDHALNVQAGVLAILASGTGNLYVGNTGTGSLNVTGGRVTNTFGYLGYSIGGVGTATVSSGTWANSGALVVGESGDGTLNVSGGSVTNTAGVIGHNAGSVGTVTVSSGTWINSYTGGELDGFLIVGYDGTGTLNVTGGTVVNDLSGVIASGTESNGAATISSGTWAMGGDLYIGVEGTGTLNVSGGSVTNSIGYLGYAPGSVGTAAVSGGTWANSGNLAVGVSGTGSLTMSGGLVTVGGTLSRGGAGTINLNSGGTLQIGVGGTNGVLGVSTLTNNGTLIFNRSDASTYSGIISGSGAVTKQGGGTLTLDGANSYSGVTTISGGVLALSGTGSIGTGDLNLGSGGVFDLNALASGTYSLPSTGALVGSGTLTGNGRTLAVLGAFQPGNSPGTVTVDTGFTLDLSGATSTTFDITSPFFTVGTYDLVNGNGNMIFGGILNLAFSGGSYADGTNVLQLFANTGGFSGDFTSVVSTGLAAGQFATFNATTGYVSVVPEPSTYAMAFAGLACGGWQMFRRRRLRQASTLAA
jgi:T5SS/PEP-CTERM-associated repeat protein/autotransporter-associated beta strand protein